MWGLRFCSTERRKGTIDCSLDPWQDGGGEEEGIFLVFFFLSIKQAIKKTVKSLYVFVGISNFKIPLCIYYFYRDHC